LAESGYSQASWQAAKIDYLEKRFSLIGIRKLGLSLASVRRFEVLTVEHEGSAEGKRLLR
jgi:hypothetical protein